MDVLQGDDQKLSLDSLNEREYAEVFSTFLNASSEYQAMCSLAKVVIDGFNVNGLNLMSIGAGTGVFEDALIKHYGLSLDYFYAIEPNKDHMKQLETTVAEWKIRYTIDNDYFTPVFNNTKERFDLVFMAHSMYCIPDRAEAICHAKSFLKRNGKLVIFHQSERGVCQVYRKFLSLASLRAAPINDHDISCESLARILLQKGISYYIKEEPSYLDVGDFIMKRDIHSASHVITFMLQSWYEKIPPSVQLEIYEMVKKGCLNPEPGKFLFQHPSAMIVIESK